MSKRQIVGLRVQKAGESELRTGLQVTIANDFLGRLVGLLTHSSLLSDSGLLLEPCGSIHTFGMRFTIDVIFLDKAGVVLGFADAVPPNRIRIAPRGTAKVLEIAEGNRTGTGIHLDDRLFFG